MTVADFPLRHDRTANLVRYVNVFVNLATGVYLILLPVEEFLRSPVWAGALPLIPGENPATLGIAFLVAGCLVPWSASLRNHVALLGWLGLTVGGVTWGLLAGSFGYAAWQLGGLGALGLIGASAFLILHLGSLFLARPVHHRR